MNKEKNTNPQIDSDELDYIIAHLQQPETLLNPEFQEWLSEDEHARLFYDVQINREAWITQYNYTHIHVEQEYKHFIRRHRHTSSRRFIRYGSIAASIIIILSLTLLLHDRNSSTSLDSEQSHPIYANGVQLILETGETLQPEKEHIVFENQYGVKITNDSNKQLAYTQQTIASNEELVFHTLRIPANTDYCITLSDGTKVWLNCETTLRYPIQFQSSKREVFLDGEAFFEVEKSSEWPFHVITDKMNVTVTGTKFNVNSYRTTPIIHTTLVEGEVHVNDRILKASEQYTLNRQTGRTQVEVVDTDLYTGWINGMFVFKSQRLEEVLTTLSRWYGIEVFYKNEAIKNISFSGSLPRYESVDTVLNMIEKIGKVDFTRKDKTLIVSGK